jgi:Major Facilitator Superfamily
MTILFAAWYGSKCVDVYTLRLSPVWQSWMAFGRLVTFAWLWRFLWTLLQPHLVNTTYQIRAPVMMIIAMIIFIIMLCFIENDLIHTKQSILPIHHHIGQSLRKLINSYKKTFIHGRIFIERCGKFPLIPLSIAFWEWIFFWSLWFIIPLYLSQHHEYISYGFEIGVYEIINLIFAIIFWYIADKYNIIHTTFIWWFGILIGIGFLYMYPSIESMIIIGIVIGLSNSLLYATGQHILSEHDTDHKDDGAYGQTRSMITNIWYMFMPVIWWLLQFMNFKFIIELFASILSCFAIMGIIITFYVLIIKKHNIRLLKTKKNDTHS